MAGGNTWETMPGQLTVMHPRHPSGLYVSMSYMLPWIIVDRISTASRSVCKAAVYVSQGTIPNPESMAT